MEIYLTKSASLHRVMQLIDLSTGVQESDLMLLDLLCEHTKPFTIVLTKADKVKSKFVEKNAQQVIDTVLDKGLSEVCLPIVHMCSTFTGYGMHELKCGMIMQFDQQKLIE